MEPGAVWKHLAEEPGSAAAAASWGSSEVQVFVIRADRQVWDTFWDGEYWHEWHCHGGSFRGEPAASARDADRIDVFAVNLEGRLMHRVWDGTAWLDWAQIDGSPSDATAASCEWSGKRLDVFVRDSDGRLWHRGLEA